MSIPIRCAALALLASFSRADVLVVAADGSGDHPDVQAAIDAASEGDTLLVRQGLYPPFVVDGRSLTIVGVSAPLVRIDGCVRVRNLGEGRTVVLQNLSARGVRGVDASRTSGLLLEDVAGSVRVQACAFVGAKGVWQARDGAPGVRLERCFDAALARCTGSGGTGLVEVVKEPSSRSGAGISIVASGAVLAEGTYEGGDGANGVGLQPNGAHGGHGCFAYRSLLHDVRILFRGGDGGNTEVVPCLSGGSNAGSGGYGVRLEALSRAVTCASEAYGGTGGRGGGSTCSHNGGNGLPRSAAAGSSFVFLDRPPPTLYASSPQPENAPLQIRITGAPGDRVHLLTSHAAGRVELPAQEGVLLVGLPASVVELGVVPASGELIFHLPAIALADGVGATVLHLQASHASPDGDRRLGTAATMVVLDEDY